MATTPKDFISSCFYYAHNMTLLGLLVVHLHFISFDYLIIHERPSSLWYSLILQNLIIERCILQHPVRDFINSICSQDSTQFKMIRMFCQHIQHSDSCSSEGHLIGSDPTCLWFALILILPRIFFLNQISASMQILRSISETPLCWQEAQKSRDDGLLLSTVFTFHFCYGLDFNAPRFILEVGLLSVRPKLIFKYSVI